MKIKEVDGIKYAMVKVSAATNCQSCNKEFEHEEVFHYVSLDNTLICLDCSKQFEGEKQLRIRVDEK